MRTRFAPSPTGYLHVGSLRTALFAWALARQAKGKFLVRVEDTDKEREVDGAMQQMLGALRWAGIEPDEGVMLDDTGNIVERGTHGPYTQSQRLALYKTYADRLIENGHAYYAFDTKEEIDAMRAREQAAGNPAPKYDVLTRMRMRNSLTLPPAEAAKLLAEGCPCVVRLLIPQNEEISWDDEIRGHVSFRSRDIDDQVLLKSDGFPTYHLAHVVDDHSMAIDLVLRGEEWLSSTPKHLLLFRMLDLTPPRYAHVPLLLNSDRSKLSKRQGDVSVDEYIHKGFLPEALINFVMLLGWNPGTEQEMFSLDAFVESFSLDRVQKAGAVFDLQKLSWLQGQWMRRLSQEDFASRILPIVAASYPQARNDTAFHEKAALIQERITFLPEAEEMLACFYASVVADPAIVLSSKQHVDATNIAAILSLLLRSLETVMSWTVEGITAALDAAMQQSTLKKGQVLWVLRAILTGRAFSPGAYEVAALLEKEETLSRLRAWQATHAPTAH